MYKLTQLKSHSLFLLYIGTQFKISVGRRFGSPYSMTFASKIERKSCFSPNFCAFNWPLPILILTNTAVKLAVIRLLNARQDLALSIGQLLPDRKRIIKKLKRMGGIDLEAPEIITLTAHPKFSQYHV